MSADRGALDVLRRMAGNNAWSNLRLYRACERLSRAELEAPRTSFFPSLPKTLGHILTVDWFYLDALEKGGRGLSVFDEEVPFGGELAALAGAQADADRRLVKFTQSLRDEPALEAIVEIDRGDHVQRERVVDTLMHLFVHQIHHRGQAHAMLSGTSVKPPQLDEFFMSEELPLREAELRDLGLPRR